MCGEVPFVDERLTAQQCLADLQLQHAKLQEGGQVTGEPRHHARP
jgi:hypothetical protein